MNLTNNQYTKLKLEEELKEARLKIKSMGQESSKTIEPRLLFIKERTINVKWNLTNYVIIRKKNLKLIRKEAKSPDLRLVIQMWPTIICHVSTSSKKLFFLFVLSVIFYLSTLDFSVMYCTCNHLMFVFISLDTHLTLTKTCRIVQNVWFCLFFY